MEYLKLELNYKKSILSYKLLFNTRRSDSFSELCTITNMHITRKALTAVKGNQFYYFMNTFLCYKIYVRTVDFGGLFTLSFIEIHDLSIFVVFKKNRLYLRVRSHIRAVILKGTTYILDIKNLTHKINTLSYKTNENMTFYNQ